MTYLTNKYFLILLFSGADSVTFDSSTTGTMTGRGLSSGSSDSSRLKAFGKLWSTTTTALSLDGSGGGGRSSARWIIRSSSLLGTIKQLDSLRKVIEYVFGFSYITKISAVYLNVLVRPLLSIVPRKTVVPLVLDKKGSTCYANETI